MTAVPESPVPQISEATPVPRRALTTPFNRLSDGSRRTFVLATALSTVTAALLLIPREALQASPAPPTGDDPPAETEPTVIAHSVFFTLHESTPAAREQLVAACEKYLTGHEGVRSFSAGPRADGYDREVNDTAFDVALLILFESEAAHDRYQDHPRHREFVAENKAAWKAVRVFDSVGK